MSTTFYRQCRLVKGTSETTSWVPEELAKVGKRVKLKDGDGWDAGWEIVSASPKKNGKLVEARAHNSDCIWKPSTALTTRGNK